MLIELAPQLHALFFGGTAIYSDVFNGLSNFINGSGEAQQPDPNVNFALSSQVQSVQPFATDTLLGPAGGDLTLGAVATAIGGPAGVAVAACGVNIAGWNPCPEGVFGYGPLPLSINSGPVQLPGQINSMDLVGCSNYPGSQRVQFLGAHENGPAPGHRAHGAEERIQTARTRTVLQVSLDGLSHGSSLRLRESTTGRAARRVSFPEIPCKTPFRQVPGPKPVANLTRANHAQATQINNNTTASTPFALQNPNGEIWVYFQGTDNALWKVKADGTGQNHVGDNMPAGQQYTASMPFVALDANSAAWIYHQRPGDRALLKIKADGSQLSQINNNTTASTPFVLPDAMGAWVYFRGTDNALWKVRDNGTQQSHIGENTPAGKQYTASMPWVARMPSVARDPQCGTAWIYYQRPADLPKTSRLTGVSCVQTEPSFNDSNTPAPVAMTTWSGLLGSSATASISWVGNESVIGSHTVPAPEAGAAGSRVDDLGIARVDRDGGDAAGLRRGAGDLRWADTLPAARVSGDVDRVVQRSVSGSSLRRRLRRRTGERFGIRYRTVWGFRRRRTLIPKGTRTAFRAESELFSERSDAGTSIVQEVFGFVKRNLSGAQRRKSGATRERGAGKGAAALVPASAHSDPERELALGRGKINLGEIFEVA